MPTPLATGLDQTSALDEAWPTHTSGRGGATPASASSSAGDGGG